MSVPEGWAVVDEALEREFSFESYREGLEFLTRVAEAADAENHHPDLDLRYKKVVVRWTTHSAGGITDRDREMAARTNELA
jgi:4a-hydroxytetrahydrobiopterin dehydratase